MKDNNQQILDALAITFGEKVFDWCDGETLLEDCICDCMGIFRDSIDWDGYKLAKEFERKGYSPDAELVEILDGVGAEKAILLKKHLD
jgi:hypothetical protein